METAGKPMRIEVAADPEALAGAYARWMIETMATVKGPFRMALCGGHTPRPLYRLLGSEGWRNRIEWDRLWIFWGDERDVPADDPDNNAHLARDLWLDHVPLTATQVHPMPTDGPLEDCAARYEATLKRVYGAETLDPARPLFDVVLLGVGEDGHTASLLPGTPALDEQRRWVASVPTGGAQPRLTLTYPAIASSRFVTFLVTGANKSNVVAAVRADTACLPATRIASDGEVIWFLDMAAAHGISQPEP